MIKTIECGTLVSGSKARHNRRWAAVFLNEEDIIRTIEEINKEHNVDITMTELEPDMPRIVLKYTASLLGGAQWNDALRNILEWMYT